MKLRTLLLHADSDDRFAVRLEVAAALARAHDAKIIAVGSLLPPIAPMSYGEYIPAQAIEAQVESERKRIEALRLVVADRLPHAGVAWEWRSLEGYPEAVLPGAGVIADLIVMGQEREEADSPAVAAVALTSGRPVLCVPHAGKFPTIGRRVLVAWNGSREATRAAHDALPILAQADQVILFTAPEDAEAAAGNVDMAAHLAAHGAKVEIATTTLAGLDIGAAILNAASDHSVDLIVMGAYGHSRLREWVFGGATRMLLRSMTVPTLLSH